MNSQPVILHYSLHDGTAGNVILQISSDCIDHFQIPTPTGFGILTTHQVKQYRRSKPLGLKGSPVEVSGYSRMSKECRGTAFYIQEERSWKPFGKKWVIRFPYFFLNTWVFGACHVLTNKYFQENKTSFLKVFRQSGGELRSSTNWATFTVTKELGAINVASVHWGGVVHVRAGSGSRSHSQKKQ